MSLMEKTSEPLLAEIKAEPIFPGNLYPYLRRLMDLPCHQLEGFGEGHEFGEDNAKGEKEWKSKPSISPLGMSKHLQCSLAWIFV